MEVGTVEGTGLAVQPPLEPFPGHHLVPEAAQRRGVAVVGRRGAR